MSTEESTILALQNRIKYLEAHLHLALQFLNEIETDSQDLDRQLPNQTIKIVPTSKVVLPTFLNSRTWKHNHLEITEMNDSQDLLFAKAC